MNLSVRQTANLAVTNGTVVPSVGVQYSTKRFYLSSFRIVKVLVRWQRASQVQINLKFAKIDYSY